MRRPSTSSTRFRIGSGLAAGALGFVLLGAGVNAQQPQPVVLSDSSLFSVLVQDVRRTVASSVAKTDRIQVDPRPYVDDPDLTDPDPDMLAPVSSAEMAYRKRVLVALSIAETSNPTTQDCPGTLANASPKQLAVCPATRQYTVALGRPRPGGPHYEGVVDESAQGRESGWNAIRVIVTMRGPEGSLVNLYDFVAARTDGRWTVVKRRSLLSIH